MSGHHEAGPDEALPKHTGAAKVWYTWSRRKRYSIIALLIGSIAVVVIAVAASLSTKSSQAPNVTSLDSGLTILLSNDLADYDTANALVVLGHAQTQGDASKHCSDLSEELSNFSPQVYSELLPRLLNNASALPQTFWVAGGNDTNCQTVDQYGSFSMKACGQSLPALCSQSAPAANANYADLSKKWHIEIAAKASQNITGYRDRRSFRFLGVPFANPPGRWTHSVASNSAAPIEALEPGAVCKQTGVSTSSENCLFLNIYTPFLPSPSSDPIDSRLRPVMVFVHGGSFTSGDASESFADGGNMASRGDVVVVSINYRVGVFGFLTLDDGKTNGNYGLGDQIIALQWIQKNIRDFGGDPNHMTVFGQSAGAASIRALLSSPLTLGMFSGAIMQSSPGGAGMGRPYSNYMNISDAMTYINPILDATGCSKAVSQIDCLKTKSADDLVTQGSDLFSLDGVNQASLVEDGTILNSSQLVLDGSHARQAIPIMLGTMRDDAAFFLPDPGGLNSTSTLLAAPLSLADATASGLAGYANTTSLMNYLPYLKSNITEDTAAFDVFNVTNHIATLGIFSCAAHSTAFAASLHYDFNTTYIYQMNRAFDYYPDTEACNAPVTEQYPNGDPYTSLSCHSGDNPYVFGNLKFMDYNIRDQYDYPFARQMLDSWTSFARTGNPNPEAAWLRMMGYDTDYGLGTTEPWTPTTQGHVNVRRLGPIASEMIGAGSAEDQQFCNLLGLSLPMYA